MIPLRLLAPLAALALVAAGCGSSSKTSTDTTSTAAAPATTSTAAAAPSATTGETPAIANGTDLTKAPVIAKPSGDPPTALVKKDLVVGKGPVLKAGQTATVQYVGSSWSNGKVFDSSWKRGQPVSFPIGVGQVIPGWDQAVPGMRVGGRRVLVIPPAQGYGQSPPPGSGIAPGETLVFVIDLKKAA